ncbi:MAG: DNA replication/repair protein RecF [Ruminococcus sp.]|nr:DNA replication/repair protein RecF [Ruminococcus sp.]
MRVKSISYRNYRNLQDGFIEPCDGVNVIYGDNAQGKTNLIEALWLFCGGHSFRTSKDSEVIKWNTDFARLDLSFYGQERDQNAGIIIGSKRKLVSINGVEKKSSSALIEKFCAVVFSPEHLNLIKRGPNERRRFIDSAICREKLQNAVILSKYNRMLVQRNALLKDILHKPYLEETLDIWDNQLVHYGALLIKKRLDYIKMLSSKASEFHSGISKNKEELKIRYISTADVEETDTLDQIKEKLTDKNKRNRKNDIKLGVTLSGPHRDDIEIDINKKNAKSFASQGQQRSAVLSLKLAEAAVLRVRMGEEPVILLDDVLSELDAGRQDFLLNELKGCQVFITCCEQSNKEQLKEGKVFHVVNGMINQE